MSREVRASALEEKMTYREPGMDPVTIKSLDYHGDTVLVTATDGLETSLDTDTVVEVLAQVPTLVMDIQGHCYGGAYWTEADYRVQMATEDDEENPVILWVEDTGGNRVGHLLMSPEMIEGLSWMAHTNHDLGGYEDDWTLPPGLDRVLTWVLPTDNDDVNVSLTEDQISEVGEWLTYATGEKVWDGGEEWEF